jgi:tetratricopeptide (TPR) repeat protein
LLMLQGNIALSEQSLQEAASALLAADNAYPQVANRVGLALAYEAQQEWGSAMEQWQKLISGQGEVLQEGFPADLALAHLHWARLSTRAGNTDVARQHYQEFLRIWQQSDDLPQRREAAAELQRLVRKSE